MVASSRHSFRSRGREGASPLNTAAFRCFQSCQQQSKAKAGAVSMEIDDGMGRRWRSLTWKSRCTSTPIVDQKRAATGQWSVMWLAVSRVASHRGQPAPAASTMVFRRSVSRVWTRDKVSSHPKNLTRDGAWHLQINPALAELTPPKLHSL
jgi:hypothetical protein